MTSENKTATANGADGVEGLSEAMQATSIQDLGRKVFIGNLNFATSEDQLRDVFGKYGSITDVQIILRGSRSLGYGFVTFATTHEAEQAVIATDKSDVDGRSVNVEIAKPTPGHGSGRAPRPNRGHRSSKKSATNEANENGDKPAGDTDKENESDHPRDPKPRRGRGRGHGRNRGGSRARPRRQGQEADGEGAPTDAESPPNGAQGEESDKTGSKRGRGRGRGGFRGERRPRKVGPPEGEASKTLLFVANLPFELTDEALKEFFSAYKVTSAHVVRRRYGYSSGKSKGFGFVEFATEDDQLRALEETEGKELEGRALHVKIAVNETKSEEAPTTEADVKA